MKCTKVTLSYIWFTVPVLIQHEAGVKFPAHKYLLLLDSICPYFSFHFAFLHKAVIPTAARPAPVAPVLYYLHIIANAHASR